MTIATANLKTETMGDGPFIFDLPVKAAKHIYKGTLVSQLTADGFVVPYSTASSGVCIGVAQFESDNTAAAAADGDKRVRIESRRCYALTNGAGGDAFSEASLIGSVVYASDDHTVADNSNSAAYKAVGFFMGMESDGKVRVFIDPMLAKIVDCLKTLTDTPASADALRDNIVSIFG